VVVIKGSVSQRLGEMLDANILQAYFMQVGREVV
jgi:hypothetical protein